MSPDVKICGYVEAELDYNRQKYCLVLKLFLETLSKSCLPPGAIITPLCLGQKSEVAATVTCVCKGSEVEATQNKRDMII